MKFFVVLLFAAFIFFVYKACEPQEAEEENKTTENVKEEDSDPQPKPDPEPESIPVTKENAIEYNDAVIEQQSIFIDELIKFNEALSEGRVSVLNLYFERLEDRLNKSIEAVKSMDDFDGSSDFKDAMLRYFKVYDLLMINEYTRLIKSYELQEEDYSAEIADAITKLEETISEKKSAAFDDLIESQKAFAAEYDFTLNYD